MGSPPGPVSRARAGGRAARHGRVGWLWRACLDLQPLNTLAQHSLEGLPT